MFGSSNPPGTSFRVQSSLDTSFLVTGATGFGTIEFDFMFSCSGGNPAVDNGRPLLRISNGSDSAGNQFAGFTCLSVIGPSPNPGTLVIPFEFGVTPVRVEMDTFPLQYFVSQFFCCEGTLGARSMTATARVFDNSGFEVTDARLLEIPEPRAVWLLALSLAARVRPRRT
jgi:hypothetical protein